MRNVAIFLINLGIPNAALGKPLNVRCRGRRKRGREKGGENLYSGPAQPTPPQKQIALNCGEDLVACVSLNSGEALNLMQISILLSFKWGSMRKREL